MLYLLKTHDKSDTFGFQNELERSQCLQWMFFWHGSGAPYQGQVNHFTRAAPEKIPYAIERFKKETLRVYGVLEIQLSGKYAADGKPREYLAGEGKGKYSVADIKTWPWVKGWERSGFTEEDVKPFPHLRQWVSSSCCFRRSFLSFFLDFIELWLISIFLPTQIDRIAARPAVQRGIGEDYVKK